MPASDVRFRRPNTITRAGLYVYVNLEYYAAYTSSVTECRAYNAAGQALAYPFTDADGFLSSSGSGTWHGTYWTSNYVTQVFVFDNAAVAASAVTIHAWLYNYNAVVIDYV
jgi:hypothetical protein